MPPVKRWKLLPLCVVLTFGAACAAPPSPTVQIGAGLGFLPQVADSLGDVGLYPSVVTDADGLPVVAYFGFEEEVPAGGVPVTRPVGAPSAPAVLLATVSAEGYWTRGAIAIEAQIPNVSIPFNPAFEPSVADLTPKDVTGLALVADGDTYHAVWGSADGVYYATGSLDPATTMQAQVAEVTKTAGVGPSIALVGGEPRIAFYTSTSSQASVRLATPDGDTWSVDTVADGAGCDTCRTAVVDVGGGAVVAYSNGGDGVEVASNDGENGWVSFEVPGGGGQGLAGIPRDGGLALSYYDAGNGQVTLATGDAGGPFSTDAAGETTDGSETGEGARTALAASSDGSFDVSWTDDKEGVVFVTGQAGSLERIETGTSTADGAFPSVTQTEDGSVSYVAWYATQEQDLLVGAYGEFQDVPFAAPSPTPTGPITTAAPPSQECTPVQNGTVTVVAQSITYAQGSCIQAVAGQPFTIEFDNRDAGVDHNIEIFSGQEPTGDTLFQGDIITGPDQATYDVPALDAGTYAFNCVIHPTQMVGEIRVSGSGGGGGGGQGGSGAGPTTVTASGIAYDTSTINLTAGKESTIHFVNQDAGIQHNIAIYPSANDLADPLFQGEIITGPAEIDYVIPPLDAGEYYFHCDIHATMNGTVSVS